MNKDKTIRVMTVDDHEIMRGGIRFLLLAFDDLEFVAEAHSGEEAVKLCSKATPDVVLMDMKMTGMDGVATTKAIKESHPSVHVLALTSFYDAELVRRALDAGAVGYMLKDASKEELADAIRAAQAGRTTLSPNAASALAQKMDVLNSIGNDLTEREREVLTLLTEGLSNSQIAERLKRSPFTIRHHVSQVISKLGAANRAEAAALAVKHKLLRQ